MVSRESSVLIIGGLCNGVTTSIAKYTLDNWEHVGNLQKGRCSHRAISNGDRIYVVGGYGAKRFVTDTFLSVPFESKVSTDDFRLMKTNFSQACMITQFYFFPSIHYYLFHSSNEAILNVSVDGF